MNQTNSQSNWEAMASMLRSISHPVRLMILHELDQGAKCVRDVQEILYISQSNLSQHLNALKKAELIGCHSNGSLRCYYLIKPSLVRKLLNECSKEHPIKIRPKETVIREVNKNQKKKSLLNNHIKNKRKDQ